MKKQGKNFLQEYLDEKVKPTLTKEEVSHITENSYFIDQSFGL
jgi:hypothetical protein